MGFRDAVTHRRVVGDVEWDGDRLATGDLGVPTIAAQRRLTVTDLARLGDDLLVVAAPEALSNEDD